MLLRLPVVVLQHSGEVATGDAAATAPARAAATGSRVVASFRVKDDESMWFMAAVE
jgi:hypothetical protein